jgi:hypothetical protein
MESTTWENLQHGIHGTRYHRVEVQPGGAVPHPMPGKKIIGFNHDLDPKYEAGERMTKAQKGGTVGQHCSHAG